MREKRLQIIEDYIHAVGTVSLDELCEKFNVSKNTIRRDINELVQFGTIQKVYGGVTSVSNQLIPFENRNTAHPSEKKMIGKYAAQLIESNDLVFIDSGTTTRNIMEFLPASMKITILTNNLDVVNSAAKFDHINLMVIGNIYKRETKSFVGIDGLQFLDKYNITKAFMAATGVSIANGLTNSDILEYEIKQKISEKAQKNYLLVDSSKIGRSALLTYAKLDQVDTIITNKPLPEEYNDYCSQNGISVIIAKD